MKAADNSAMNRKRMLLVGDMQGVITENCFQKDCEVDFSENILDAISAVSRREFDIIGVTMDGSGNHLKSSLKALRYNFSGKIILLARMWQEPEALSLVTDNAVFSADSGRFEDQDEWEDIRVADDYLICPLENHGFESVIEPDYFRRSSADNSEKKILTAPQQERIQQLEKMATEDELTSLKNRRYIWEFSRQILEYARTNDGQMTLMVFDIDNFKQYNDEFGHSAGDEILKQVSLLMRRSCRGHDVVGRIGGDEFAVVFWDEPSSMTLDMEEERRSLFTTHPNQVIAIAKRFRTELNNAELHLLGEKGKGVLTISGALASFPQDGTTIDELFIEADKALMDAKHSGKNQIYIVGNSQGDISEIQ